MIEFFIITAVRTSNPDVPKMVTCGDGKILLIFVSICGVI
jgi:hypothetical protein